MEMLKKIGKYTYFVEFDERSFREACEGKNHGLGLEYSNRFVKGELGSFVIIKKEICDCCSNLKWIDSLGGIDAELEAQEYLDKIIKFINYGIPYEA